MGRLLLALLALLVAVPAAADPASDARVAVERAMADSAAGWNARDLDRFVAIYADEPATTFTGSSGIVRGGHAALRQRYLDHYRAIFAPGAAGPVPVLSFAFQDFRLLGPDHALLIAEWRLAPAVGEPMKGMTSLVFRRDASGWHVIADHSS